MRRTTQRTAAQAPSGVLLAVAAIVGIAASPATAEDTAASVYKITIACTPGQQTFEVPPREGNVEVAWDWGACTCFWTAEDAVHWMAWKAEHTSRMTNGRLMSAIGLATAPQQLALAPGERKEVNYFCFTQDQVTAYLEAVVPVNPASSPAP